MFCASVETNKKQETRELELLNKSQLKQKVKSTSSFKKIQVPNKIKHDLVEIP